MSSLFGRPPLAGRWERLGDGEVAIWAVWNHCLTQLETELGAIELYRNHVWLERHRAGDTADLRISVRIQSCRETCSTDVEMHRL